MWYLLFFNSVRRALFINFFFLSNMSQMCDNTDEVKLNLFEFLANYDAKDLEKDKACFKIPLNPRCIDFFYFK